MNEYADTLAQYVINDTEGVDGADDQATIIALVISNLAHYLADTIDA